MTQARTRYTRTPYLIVHKQKQAAKEVYASVDDSVVLHAQLMRGDNPSDTVMICMHPIGSPGYLPMFSQLAREGHHVIGCSTRYTQGDAALQMENVLLDLGACARDAKDRLGYRNVVLAGYSGGGSLMAAYQAEAEQPIIKQTAAGEPTALADTSLVPADGLMLLAAHRSRHHLLTEQLDPSVTDELNPRDRNSTFDLYDTNNPAQPPYDPGFVAEYRDAQRERNRRISRWARDTLDELKTDGHEQEEFCFVVHRTMADPRWIDPAVDPNDREPNTSWMGRPDLVNNSPAALGRYSSLRSWLSQWSLDDAQVDAVDAGPRISIPTLTIAASADDVCPPSHTAAINQAIGAQDHESHTINGARHYFSGPDGKAHLGEAMSLIAGWTDRLGLR